MIIQIDFENWLWTIEDGKVELWKNLSDEQLANVYCYFRANLSHPYRKHALSWLIDESLRRNATSFFENVDNYGCYPYKQLGRYVVYDKTSNTLIPLAKYDWNLLPPQVKIHFTIIDLLIGIE